MASEPKLPSKTTANIIKLLSYPFIDQFKYIFKFTIYYLKMKKGVRNVSGRGKMKTVPGRSWDTMLSSESIQVR